MFPNITIHKRSIIFTVLYPVLLLGVAACSGSRPATASHLPPLAPSAQMSKTQNHIAAFQALGTRSWIRLSWSEKQIPNASEHFTVEWTDQSSKQSRTQVVSAASRRFYIHPVLPGRHYQLRVEDGEGSSTTKKILYAARVFTDTLWHLAAGESEQLDIPSSAAVPEGMQLFFHDEFNDSLLNRNKWFDTYYSTLDYDNRVQWDAFQKNDLPKASYHLNGNYIDLFVNDSLPKTAFFKDGKKISSIQTYDWVTNTNLLHNELGGYYEVRVRRNYTGHPAGLNTAFWFDSPGPDLRYYYQQGTTINGVSGIRPKGQLFEIDMFENMNAQFVMHGHVDTGGHFIHNLATDIAKGYQHRDNWVVHGLLWTPNAIKHYINGKLIYSYDNPHAIYSPDHFMNVLLGAYGKGGSVSLQVDYIRAYQWPVTRDNELPNPGFELNDNLLPWEGKASISKSVKISGERSAKLEAGDSLFQYVYVRPGQTYDLTFSALGSGSLSVAVDQVKEVTGIFTKSVKNNFDLSGHSAKQHHLTFRTAFAPKGHTRTIRIRFKNNSGEAIYLDDMTLKR